MARLVPEHPIPKSLERAATLALLVAAWSLLHRPHPQLAAVAQQPAWPAIAAMPFGQRVPR